MSGRDGAFCDSIICRVVGHRAPMGLSQNVGSPFPARGATRSKGSLPCRSIAEPDGSTSCTSSPATRGDLHPLIPDSKQTALAGSACVDVVIFGLSERTLISEVSLGLRK